MSDSDFFSGIVQVQHPWAGRPVGIPVFYHDVTSLTVLWLAPLERVRAILPSRRMHPYRATPRHGVVVLSAYAYRDTAVGPYDEVSIGVPFVLDRPAPLFTGLLRPAPAVPLTYIHRLPVSVEAARAIGVDLAAFPKFLAAIAWADEGGWLRCRVEADGQHLLTLAGRRLALAPRPRMRIDPVTCAAGRLLRLELIVSARQAGLSRGAADVRLELGDHPVAQELRALRLGRAVQYEYSPRHQAILTAVCESYAL